MDLTIASQEVAVLSQNLTNFALLHHFGNAACCMCTFCVNADDTMAQTHS
jgi:hypothetical protein